MKLVQHQAKRVRAHNLRIVETRFFGVMPILLLTICVVMRGCNYPDDYVQFKNLSQDQQKAQFKQLPIDKQIDYYLYDQSHEPPRMGFDKDIASQGRSVLPAILRRLKLEPEEYRQQHLIWLLEVMHKESVPLNEDKQVIDTVEKVVSRLTDPTWREMSQKSLQVIRAKPGTPGPGPSPFPYQNATPSTPVR